ncbi:glycosyl hydrolase family 18 (putative chitinase) [Motilibacter peucedani]|uniref:Glycosyl hydrolase family 18 (Putative chitinase) n=1 Tax=Motilibacter peucedani TaxID=598650 RepID=A0A420XKC1_9ACTN|nr:glycoside hydrolase family 9 protein [Motilibacter peucedani]RKS68460.1 glycosyl hydrolase family 18 (putative chitinase) [Motilibacter peucedani]
MPRSARAAVISVLAVLAATGGVGAAPASAASVRAVVRVDQVGYLPAEEKHAFVLASRALHGSYAVLDAHGSTVASGALPSRARGSWSAAWPAVYEVSFSSVRAPGRYTVRVSGDASAVSVPFSVRPPGDLYGPLVADGVSFFGVQRDGATVPGGPLRRQPSHLHDASADVYATPSFDPDSDAVLEHDLTRTGGPVDVSGGWFDAGDYLKFTHTAAYADILLLASERSLGAAAPNDLRHEARRGQSWLAKMWDEGTRTLHLQVGLGGGSADGSFLGDHDLWRLPEADDATTARGLRYATSHRPVFDAAPAGQPVSPNLAGRVAAAFAMAAQVDARTDRHRATRELRRATSLYALADTASPPEPLTTALPNDFYPESTWRDDMELGGAEIALASQALGVDGHAYLAAASRWARAYLATETGDTFNLYDTSALAHLDLVRALAADGRTAAVSPATLLGDVRRQLATGVRRAASDPFRAGGVYTDFDVNAHTWGLVATEGWYERLTGSRSYAGFATSQRDWLLGANAWGVSSMVGAGTTFPRCMQHQVANLRGSTDGTAPLAVGAVVNGPNSSDLFADGLDGLQEGMRACSVPGYAAFDGHGSSYVDDVRSWQTDEPALDMTGTAVAAAAAQLALASPAGPPDAPVPAPGRTPEPLPAHVFAPYFEAYTGESPLAVSRASGAKHLTLAFFQTERPGSCTVWWNGDTSQPVSPATWGADIAAIQARGGDVIPSFGGYSADSTGTDIADSCSSVSKIAEAYESVIRTYSVSRIDLDVEDASLANAAAVVRRNRAINRVQRWAAREHVPLQVSYTLPTSTHGLEDDGLAVLRSAEKAHARIDVVNIMTFDYYDDAPHDMLRDAQGAATALVGQLADLHPGVPTDRLWSTVGVTQMLGIDDYGPPEVFRADQAVPFERWAERAGIGTVSFWALQRDNGGCVGTAGSDSCSGVAQRPWQFTRALLPFTR